MRLGTFGNCSHVVCWLAYSMQEAVGPYVHDEGGGSFTGVDDLAGAFSKVLLRIGHKIHIGLRSLYLELNKGWIMKAGGLNHPI
uniref:Uncharacterized protein n=1 Tax=Oryza meridionalis TaxID=40149 RepID=A0A0E0CJE4_9ORYZ